jgi:uncharacterized membrane protein YjgN (DUF898 family)
MSRGGAVAETFFKIVYRGKILRGFDFDTAKRKLMEMFALSAQKAEKVLKSRRVVLTKVADEATARKVGVALKRAGLDVVLQRTEADTVSHKPTVGSTSQYAKGVPGEESEDTAKGDEKPSGEQAAAQADWAPAETVARIPFEFLGTGTEYFRIWLVNVILSIVTLGIYSPWAKVRRKQYFYGSTRMQGASFEYLADPVKILKGRAIVVAVLIVQSIVSRLIPVVGIVFSLAFVVVLPWLVVRSLAFNARNSALRNIRFGFDGTVGEAAKVFILWPIVAVLTLGILTPYVYFRQKKFVAGNSSYGTTRFTFTATAGEYYRLFFGAFIPIVIGIAVIAASGFLFPPAAVLLVIVLYLYLFAYFSAKTTNLCFNSSQLALHRLEANLKVKEYVVLVLTNSVGIALTLGLFHPWAKVRTLRYKLKHLKLIASGDLDNFIAKEQDQVSALGEEMSDLLDFDFGL